MRERKEQTEKERNTCHNLNYFSTAPFFVVKLYKTKIYCSKIYEVC